MRTFAVTGEYHELFMAQPWERLVEIFTSLNLSPARILDIGAGSGMGITAYRTLWPSAHVTAVEPDHHMRGMLMGKIAENPDLASHVDVLPWAVTPESLTRISDLVGKVDLVIASHMINILSAPERAAVYRLINQVCTGRAIITTRSPHSHDEEKVFRLATQDVREQRDDEGLGFTHRQGDQTLRSVWVQRSHKEPLPTEDIAAEAAEHGLRTVATIDHVVVFEVVGEPPVLDEPDYTDLCDRHNERLSRLNPLLGASPVPAGADLVIDEGDLVGWWTRRHTDPESSLALWGAVNQDVLQLRADTDIDPARLSDLLDRFEIARLGRGIDTETHAVIRLPAHEPGLVHTLRSHGYAPSTVTAVHQLGSIPPVTEVGGVTFRHLQRDDRQVIEELFLGLYEIDHAYSITPHRDNARELLRDYVTEVMNRDPEWTWVAEKDGTVVGVMTLIPPDEAAWAAPSTTISPVGYLGHAYVTQRGHGIGSALATRVLHTAVDHDLAGILLDHEALSPLASTFWHRTGFIPLWTTWVKP